MEYAKKVNPGVPAEKRTVRTVQGWVKVSLMAAGLSIADERGSLEGPAIKDALESLRGWNAFGKENALGRPPVTITSKDHRVSSIVGLYTIKDGKIELFEKIDMKEKFADKWDSWLGW
jgi:branched-chain amino acid transport system substrate-binding protein